VSFSVFQSIERSQPDMTKNCIEAVRVIRCVAVAVAVSALAACAGPQVIEINASDRDDVARAAKVAVIHYDTPRANFMTPASVAGGGLLPGAIASWTKSKEAPTWSQVMHQHRVPDPTETVQGLFLAGLQNEARTKNLVPESEATPLPVPENPSAVKAPGNAPYVLEISTLNTYVGYEVMNWRNYTFVYAAQARLVRARDSHMVWKGTCAASGYKDSALGLRIEDILGMDGVKVRQVYNKATRDCSRQLLDQYLGRKPPAA
jgi:hypothetical protein